MTQTAATARHRLTVYPASALGVAEGVARGDAMGRADQLVLDDVYALAPKSAPMSLHLGPGEGPGSFVVTDGSEAGEPGEALGLDCTVTLMARDGETLEALVLAGDDTVWVYPVTPLKEGIGYRLVRIDTAGGQSHIARTAFVSFSRGTHITLETGLQVPIEELEIGDRVLTRDDGARPIRWIGQTTERAHGLHAPVVVTAGALNNTRDLVLSPDHRLMVYQRSDAVGAGRPELFVKVRDLVNDTTVYRREGGFVDYFQLLLDDHQIIFAEGIAAESLRLDSVTEASISAPGVARHSARDHDAFAYDELDPDIPDMVDRLRAASAG